MVKARFKADLRVHRGGESRTGGAVGPVVARRYSVNLWALARAQDRDRSAVLSMVRTPVYRPRVILLDESFEELAGTIVQSLLEVYRQLVVQGQTVVIVEHNVRAALSLAQRGPIPQQGMGRLRKIGRVVARRHGPVSRRLMWPPALQHSVKKRAILYEYGRTYVVFAEIGATMSA